MNHTGAHQPVLFLAVPSCLETHHQKALSQVGGITSASPTNILLMWVWARCKVPMVWVCYKATLWSPRSKPLPALAEDVGWGFYLLEGLQREANQRVKVSTSLQCLTAKLQFVAFA